MTYKSLLTRASRNLSIILLTSALSFGAVIYNSGITALKTTDPIQLGRLNRSTINGGIPSTWATPKDFPGTTNFSTVYRYEVFNIPVSPFPYLQITFDEIAGTGVDFASAYLNSYSPNSTAINGGLDVNYLGDAGNSGNYFGTDPRVFQVILPSPATNHLIVVVNNATGLTSDLSANFRVLVEGFYDTSFNDATPPVPEPTTALLSGAGLALATIAVYRKKQKPSR